ncbi:unnamed protein product [Ectocarpus sp. 6 AP-2014]
MTTMRVLRRRTAALAVGVTLVTTAAAAAAGRTAPASIRHRKRERRPVERFHQGAGAGGAAAGAGEGTAAVVVASWFRGDVQEPAADSTHAASRSAAGGAPSVGGVSGDGVAARGLLEGVEEEPDLAAIFLRMIGMQPDLSQHSDGAAVVSPAAAEGEETTSTGLAAHKRSWRFEDGKSDQEFAEKLIAGLDGPQREDLASKLIAELGQAGEQDLADTLLVGLEEAKDREEFATALAGAFDTAGRGGGGGELAEKLLSGLERDGEGQAQAATLLAGLDATDRLELAGALVDGLRRAGQDDRAHELSAGMGSARDEEELAVVIAAAFGSVRKQVAVAGRGGGAELLDNLLNAFLRKIERPAPVPGRVADEGEGQEALLLLHAAGDRQGSPRERPAPDGRFQPTYGSTSDSDGITMYVNADGVVDYVRDVVVNGVAYGVLEKRTFPHGDGASKQDAAAASEKEVEGEEEGSFIFDDDDAHSLTSRSDDNDGSSFGTRSSSYSSGPLSSSTVLPAKSKRFRGPLSSSGHADTSGLYRGGGSGSGSGGAFSTSTTLLEVEEEGIEEPARERPGGGSPLLPPPPARDTEERRRSAHGAVDLSPSPSRSFGGMLGDLFRGTFAGLLQSSEEGSGERSSPAFEEEEGEDARLFGVAEWSGRSAQARRRRLYTSSSAETTASSSDDDNDNTGGNYQVEIVASTGDTSTNWNGAAYRLEVGTVVPGQTLPSSSLLAFGTINEGDTSPWTQTLNLERGCYVLYTTAGTRPYDVVWQVEVGGEVHQSAEGGGQDYHTFGLGGALCGMSDCYRLCYEEHDDRDADECKSFGDLLAPSDEPAGANCTCSQDEQIDLRIECLGRDDCESRSQCYLLGDAAAEITTAPTLRIVIYVTIVTTNVYVDGMETAVAQWLDLDPAYVELARVNGKSTETSTEVTRRRLFSAGENEEEEEGGGVRLGSGWGWSDEKGGQRRARNRRLQTATFKRLEFRIIGDSDNDFPDITSTLSEGVRALNTVLAAQNEESEVSEVEAYTAEYSINSEDVATADTPGVSIAGSGGGTGVNEEGEVIVLATEAPEVADDDIGDFTRQTQFLVGAGLVVVVSFFLSIVACIVCHMKRRDRKEFKRRNQGEDGRPKPVAYVDPWGSVATTFQKDGAKAPSPSANGGGSSRGGSRVGNGSSAGGYGRNGSRTADSSASA